MPAGTLNASGTGREAGPVRLSPASSLEFNDLGTVRIAVARPLPLDRYEANRSNGRFILIDEATNATVAAGLIQ